MKSATTLLPFCSRAKPTFGVTAEGRGISGKLAALGQNPARTLMEDTRRETLTFLSKCHQGGGGGQFSTEVLNHRRVTTSVRLLFLVRLTKKKNGSSSVETQKKEEK